MHQGFNADVKLPSRCPSLQDRLDLASKCRMMRQFCAPFSACIRQAFPVALQYRFSFHSMDDIAAETHSLILIIDDSPEAIRLLAGMLNDVGQIIFATDGRTGIRLARQRQPHLILLDVDMPDMNGYEVCRILKTDPDTRDCAIIFVTAMVSSKSEIKALAAGAVDFISKPLTPPVVRARVQTHLKLRHQSAALAQLASRDGLTGLYNRRFMNEQLETEIQRHKRQMLPISIAMIDVDHFKPYNDGYGHIEGDTCLKRIAALIDAHSRRPGELAARFGGEEFVVILPHTNAAEAAKYGERLCASVHSLNIGHAYAPVGCITISVGVASVIPDGPSTPESLLAAADEALYRAKAAGRNCCRSAADA